MGDPCRIGDVARVAVEVFDADRALLALMRGSGRIGRAAGHARFRQTAQRLDHARARAPGLLAVLRQLPAQHRERAHAEPARKSGAAERASERTNLPVVHAERASLHGVAPAGERQFDQAQPLGEIEPVLPSFDQAEQIAGAGGDDAGAPLLVEETQEARLHEQR